jgi:glutamate/tyrosine decarboxylase-like PLP-dependent enzyme
MAGLDERHLHRLVSEHPDFEVLHEPTLDVYTFRYVPNALADRRPSPELEERLDWLNEAVAEAIQRRGLALLTTTRIRGRVALRMSICSHRSLEHDVDATFEALAGLGRRLAAEAGLGEACREPASGAGNL